MADKPLPWFRAYHEAAFDPKIEIAAAQTGLHSLMVFGAWWKILCLAGASPVRGALNVTVLKRYSNADVTKILGLDEKAGAELLRIFVELDMLEIGKDKTIRVKNWEKRQYSSDSSTDRVRKHRQNVTPVKRFSNVSVTPPDTDTESDTESEEKSAKSAPPQRTRGNPELYAIVAALSEVCHMDLETNKSRLFKEAKLLSQGTPAPTPELLKAHYNGSRAAFWRASDWRGKLGQTPTPAAIRETWGQWNKPEEEDGLHHV